MIDLREIILYIQYYYKKIKGLPMRFKAAQAKLECDQSAIKEIWVSKTAHHGCMVNKWYVLIKNKKIKKL